MEIWKTLERLPDYQVSNTGKIKSLKTNKILKQSVNNAGYLLVCLSEGNKRHTSYIHRLVAEAFIPTNYDINLCVVNHKDKDRKNNNVDNLEWNSPLENYYHSRIKIQALQLTELTELLERMSPSQIDKVVNFSKSIME
jgi:hypothetical protein